MTLRMAIGSHWMSEEEATKDPDYGALSLEGGRCFPARTARRSSWIVWAGSPSSQRFQKEVRHQRKCGTKTESEGGVRCLEDGGRGPEARNAGNR